MVVEVAVDVGQPAEREAVEIWAQEGGTREGVVEGCAGIIERNTVLCGLTVWFPLVRWMQTGGTSFGQSEAMVHLT
jgi:hypothetical protein